MDSLLIGFISGLFGMLCTLLIQESSFRFKSRQQLINFYYKKIERLNNEINSLHNLNGFCVSSDPEESEEATNVKDEMFDENMIEIEKKEWEILNIYDKIEKIYKSYEKNQ